MKNFLGILILISLLLTLVASCKDNNTPQISPKFEPDGISSSQMYTEINKPIVHLLQVNALNFLTGNVEPCKVKNKIFAVSEFDNNLGYIVCKNSKVKLLLLSDRGIVAYKAIDLTTGRAFPVNLEQTTGEYYELGKTYIVTRYTVYNPYGFTYLMVEDVTDIDPEILDKINDLNDKLSKLKEKVLLAERSGTRVDPRIYEEILILEEKIADLKM